MNFRIAKLSACVVLLMALIVLHTGHSASAVAVRQGPSASGHANFTIDGSLRTFSFNAVTHRDGTVTGSAQANNRATGVKIHMNVDCLRLLPNGRGAIMSGLVARATDPTLLGLTAVFVAEDNGEGAGAPPDRLTLLFGFTQGLVTCTHPVETDPTFETDLRLTMEGNLQVRQ
jgi:hypothetical protein